jgi:hypothetical protein
MTMNNFYLSLKREVRLISDIFIVADCRLPMLTMTTVDVDAVDGIGGFLKLRERKKILKERTVLLLRTSELRH